MRSSVGEGQAWRARSMAEDVECTPELTRPADMSEGREGETVSAGMREDFKVQVVSGWLDGALDKESAAALPTLSMLLLLAKVNWLRVPGRVGPGVPVKEATRVSSMSWTTGRSGDEVAPVGGASFLSDIRVTHAHTPPSPLPPSANTPSTQLHHRRRRRRRRQHTPSTSKTTAETRPAGYPGRQADWW